jgi:hypothetical protein
MVQKPDVQLFLPKRFILVQCYICAHLATVSAQAVRISNSASNSLCVYKGTGGSSIRRAAAYGRSPFVTVLSTSSTKP